MNKLLTLMIFIVYVFDLQAGSLTATFSYCTFDVPGKSPYVETYLKILGTSVKFVPAEKNTLKGQIQVQWIIRSGDKIIHADKYNLFSPGIETNDTLIPDFIDQQRLNLENGIYDIELSINDKNTDEKEATLRQKISIGFPTDTISISDIEFIESYSKTSRPGKYTKSGYDIIPFTEAFYPQEISKIKFYAEIYRSDISSTDDYLVRYYMTNKETNLQIENYIVSKKQSANKINVILGDFSIFDLPSGNYYLNIEVRNKTNKLIAFNRAFFQRSNERSKPIVTEDFSTLDISNTFISQVINKDSLIDFIACLYPISSQVQIEIADRQIKNADVNSMKQYFYYFWINKNKDDPEKAWLDYKAEVKKVNYSYTSRIRKGYETERGRVYLQYGAANEIVEVKDEPGFFPYEIWHYYKLNNQSNRKFVFYTTDRASNEYQLVHSDAIGEIQMPNWETFLQGNKSIQNFGNRTKDIYTNPH